MLKVFISHSSQDRELVMLLVDLLHSALNLTAEEIRVTSVEGYRLEGGGDTDTILREEIVTVPVFIGLVSEPSIDSAYVLFEMGARWGSGKHLLPLLAPGANVGLLSGPLARYNALRSSVGGDLHQVVQELAGKLDRKTESPAVYQRHIDEVLAFDRHSPDRSSESGGMESVDRSTPESLTNEEAIERAIRAHCEGRYPDDYRMQEFCISQQFEAFDKLRRGRPADIPEDVFTTIRERCARRYPGDYRMRQFCEEQQCKSFRELQR